VGFPQTRGVPGPCRVVALRHPKETVMKILRAHLCARFTAILWSQP